MIYLCLVTGFVNASGRLVPGWTEQKQLLLEEGISFKQNGCVDIEKASLEYSVSE
jgi:methylated-DNA-protein-cysteine methyltransferase-like protein